MTTTPSLFPPLAECIGPPPLVAFAEHVASLPPSTPSKKAILYTEVRRPDGTISRVAVTVDRENSEKSTGISQNTMDRIQTAVSRANTYLRAPRNPSPLDEEDDASSPLGEGIEHVRRVRIDWTAQRLIYNVNGKDTSLSMTKIRDVGLRTLLLDLAKDVEHQSTTDPSVQSNRPMNRSSPLEIHTPTWHAAHRISALDYARDAHEDLDESLRKEELSKALPPKTADTALLNIKTAADFVNAFRRQLTQEQRAQKIALHQLPIDARGHRLALTKQIRQLENLIQKLDEKTLDMKAIFRSVSYAGPDLQGLTPAEQMTRADLSQKAMQVHLVANLQSISEGLVFKDNPDAAFLTAYSQDAGDLLVHDRWAYEERVGERGGDKRGASMEEFVVFCILNLNDKEDEHVEEAMSSLALPSHEPGDKLLRKTVESALKAARLQVQTSYTEDLSKLGTSSGLAAQRSILFPAAGQP